MNSRIILVAVLAFALGATVDRFFKITGYDHVIASQARQIEMQEEMIRLQNVELNEINGILNEPAE